MATTMARIGPEFQVGLPSHPVSKCRRSPQAPKRDGKSCLEALLTWTRECSVFWKYYMAAALTNLPPVLQNSHSPELKARDAVRAARHFVVIRRRH